MKIIISIVVVMFYAVIGCVISEKVDEEYDPLYILFWPIVIACFIPIWIVSGILEGFGWLSRRLRKRKSVYAHIDQNIEKRWASEETIEKIKDIDNENELILSRKQVQNEAIDWIKQDLKEGQKVDGIVKNIKPYGAFVEIGGGIVGLIHIEDLSVARIQTPYERLKVGQKAQVMVKSINRKQGKITLSYKELLGTWEENAKNFKEGMTVKGIVRETEKNRNGIFVELTPNLVGMTEYTEGLQYGQDVDVYIRKIDYDKKKVKLAVINNYL